MELLVELVCHFFFFKTYPLAFLFFYIFGFDFPSLSMLTVCCFRSLAEIDRSSLFGLNHCFYLFYLFCQRWRATPGRKLRFQTVQSEFQMRCNSMENIKCHSQFCTRRSEGSLTLRWLARVCIARLLLFPAVHFPAHISLCFLPLQICRQHRTSCIHEVRFVATTDVSICAFLFEQWKKNTPVQQVLQNREK